MGGSLVPRTSPRRRAPGDDRRDAEGEDWVYVTAHDVGFAQNTTRRRPAEQVNLSKQRVLCTDVPPSQLGAETPIEGQTTFCVKVRTSTIPDSSLALIACWSGAASLKRFPDACWKSASTLAAVERETVSPSRGVVGSLKYWLFTT
jgi:hypothetical protein